MDKSLLTIDRMQTFVRVAERGSLSAVAREFDLGQSTITRHLRELETALGAALLSRTTRRVTLTEEGRGFYADCLQILGLVERASEEVRSTRDAVEGRVRLSCTTALGLMHVQPLLMDFQDRHPGIRIDFSLTDQQVDLVQAGMDFAIRLGPLAETSLRARKIGASRRILAAARPTSPAMGARSGPRTSPITRRFAC